MVRTDPTSGIQPASPDFNNMQLIIHPEFGIHPTDIPAKPNPNFLSSIDFSKLPKFKTVAFHVVASPLVLGGAILYGASLTATIALSIPCTVLVGLGAAAGGTIGAGIGAMVGGILDGKQGAIDGAKRGAKVGAITIGGIVYSPILFARVAIAIPAVVGMNLIAFGAPGKSEYNFVAMCFYYTKAHIELHLFFHIFGIDENKKYLDTLGLTEPFTKAEVESAYRKLALTCHPDRVNSKLMSWESKPEETPVDFINRKDKYREEMAVKFDKITEARDFLLNKKPEDKPDF